MLVSWVKCLVPRIQFEGVLVQLQKFKDMLQQCIQTVFRSQTDPSLSLNLEKAELISPVLICTVKVRIGGLRSNRFTERAFSTIFNNSNTRPETVELRLKNPNMDS